ncbi:hypothetical protein C477_22100 [Haloterrigena salina JCM 13891]|uniref:Uncharacterized protein n=2 Tax=Haloterrigena salina TaxID=504937 RepID=M0BQG3_9EURY|nr:hypothetical protein C477_22100 [Haloterrigena salina JCM 13891]
MYHTTDRRPRPPRDRTRFEANRHPDRAAARAERTSLECDDAAGVTTLSATERDTAGECR